jgi:hypothetical protein
MNRETLGLSGSYGLSVLSQVNASLYGYRGSSSASDGTETKVDYNIIMQCGIEHVNFNDLRPSEFIASLYASQQDKALSALQAYQELVDPKLPENDRLQKLRKWIDAREEFFKASGNGVVIGILWGAIGSISMTIRQNSNSSKLQYGGQANFSYVGSLATASVAATFDIASDSSGSEASSHIEKFYSGSIISKEIDDWYNRLTPLSVGSLVNFKGVEANSFPQNSGSPPSIPDFKKPEPDPVLKKKLADLENLNKLDALSKEAKFHEESKIRNDLTREAFDKEADPNSKVDAQNLVDLANEVKGNSLLLPQEFFDFAFNDKPSPINMLSMAESPSTSTKASSYDDSQYVPLGVWIANWSDLLPWLSTAALNSIPDLAKTKNLLYFQLVIQDFDALRKIYYQAHYCNLSLDDIDFLSIADSYSNQLAQLSTSTFKSNNEMRINIQKAIGGLSDKARAIYKRWNEISFLRGCELGLGIVFDEKYSLSFEHSHSQTFLKETETPWGHLKLPYFVHSDTVFIFKNTDFDSAVGNYSAFSRLMKCVPLVHPSGKIYLLGPGIGGNIAAMHSSVQGSPGVNVGPTNPYILFSSNGNFRAVWYDAQGKELFSGGDWNDFALLEFEPDSTNKILKNTDAKIKAYPIPFKAAQGISWKGVSISRNIASFEDLNSKLSHFKDLLNDHPLWTFSSSSWDPEWTGSTPYSMNLIKTQYVGIEDEPGGVFSKANDQ